MHCSQQAYTKLYFTTVKKIINIHGKLHNRKQIESAKESDENYIPKSARALDFKITLSKAAMKNTERIEFLQNMVDQAKKPMKEH